MAILVLGLSKVNSTIEKYSGKQNTIYPNIA